MSARSFWKSALAPMLLSAAILAAPGCSSDPGEDDDDDSSIAPEGPEIAVDPAQLSFGEVPLGESDTQTITVSNTGDQTLTITQLTKSGDSNHFHLDTALPATVAVNATLDIDVVFQPTSMGDLEATLTIVNDSANAPSQTVALSGEGASPDDDGDGFTVAENDCDDQDAGTYPGADETCDNHDEDCNDEIDDDPVDGDNYYPDDDDDGYGEEGGRAQAACKTPDGYADDQTDCDDSDPAIHPDATELCDDIDNDCDDDVDEADQSNDANDDGRPDCQDWDKDGYTGEQGDCNDNNGTVNPGELENPETPDDDNCNGEINENDGPAIVVLSPDPDSYVVPGAATIEVHVEDFIDPPDLLTVNFTVVRGDVTSELCMGVVPDSDGIATCDATLEYGDQVVTIEAFDSTDGINSEELHLVADNIPSIAYRAPEDGVELQYGTANTFTVEINDPDEVLTSDNVTWSSDVQGEIEPDRSLPGPAGTVSVELTLTTPGEQVITATVTDSLGGSSTASITVTVLAAACGDPNIVALWHMNEGSGSTITDEIAGQKGSMKDITWVSGPNSSFGKAINFSSETSLVTIDDPDDRLSLLTFTIDFWLRGNGSPQAQTMGKSAMVYKNGDAEGTDKPNYYIGVTQDGVLEASVARSTGGPAFGATALTALKTNTWYYVAVTFDGRYLSIYLDGKLDMDAPADAGTQGLTPLVTKGPLYLGSNVNNPRPSHLNAQLDDLQLMDCYLLPSQIELYFGTHDEHPGPQEVTPTPTPEGTPTPEPTETPVPPTPVSLQN